MSAFSLVPKGIALAQNRLEVRRFQKEFDELFAKQGALPKDTYKAIVYFADFPVNLYQMRQWYAPLRELNEIVPVAIVARAPAAAVPLIKESGLPVVLFEQIAGVEDWISTQDPKVVFYVNQNTRNFQMMRFASMLHVFLSHGESDKIYMASNQAKAYDFFFIAGQASADRLNGHLMLYNTDERTKRIGRPQVDVHVDGPALPSDDRTVVLYAPTWEGDRASMTYGSVKSHGLKIVTALGATGKHRIIYRPHPRTGIFNKSHATADGQVRAALEALNRTDPGAGHVIDVGPAMDWQFDAADACICDVSAVALDWLATGKPMLVTKPTSKSATLPTEGFLTSVRSLDVTEIDRVGEILSNPDEHMVNAQARAGWVEYYFGDVTPGASMAKWLDACKEIIALRDEQVRATVTSD